jgi:hypothetical protein
MLIFSIKKDALPQPIKPCLRQTTSDPTRLPLNNPMSDIPEAFWRSTRLKGKKHDLK